VHMMKAEELAGGPRTDLPVFTRLNDLAYAFHHEMHDQRPSATEARARVESIVRDFGRADQEIRRVRGSAELQAEWREVARLVERMRVLMSL
jgi:hypothetical protein